MSLKPNASSGHLSHSAADFTGTPPAANSNVPDYQSVPSMETALDLLHWVEQDSSLTKFQRNNERAAIKWLGRVDSTPLAAIPLDARYLIDNRVPPDPQLQGPEEEAPQRHRLPAQRRADVEHLEAVDLSPRTIASRLDGICAVVSALAPGTEIDWLTREITILRSAITLISPEM